jgi:hypothetical protein
MNREVYLHIGYPKTGSKFLQFEIFPRLAGIHYVPSPLIRTETSRILKQDEFSFDEEEVRRGIERRLREGKNLISNEGFIGDFFIYRLINSKLIADRLARLFPQAKILIVLRSQPGLIESLYKQYLHIGGTKGLREFVGFRNGRFDSSYYDGGFGVNLDLFHYLPLISYYEKLFGKERLLILPFELLKKSRDEFLRRVLVWMGVAEFPRYENRVYNEGYGARQVTVARFFNRFLKSKLRETGLFPDVAFPVTGKIDAGKARMILQSPLSRRLLGRKPIRDELLKAKIREHYGESNRVLNEKYQLGLEAICPDEYF